MARSNNNCNRIFVQNRSLGYVSNEIPHIVRYIKRRRENLVVTCVGKAFHTYGCDRLNLLSVSPQHAGKITCLSADTFLLYSASANDVYAWRRGVELKHTYHHSKSVHLIFPFGPHLITIDEDSCIYIWEIRTENLQLQLNFDNEKFRISAICHPNTYINKILLGSQQGSLQLWNINRAVMIHNFVGWGSAIKVLEQTPAIDVVVIGLQNGKIVLHNLKYDQTIFSLKQDCGPVTALSFRTDGQMILASASTSGCVVIWDLEERKVMSQLRTAHNRQVTGMTYLPNEPLMVTSSPDNSLKMWIFDMSDGGGRLLKSREGHHAPPSFIRFYNQIGNTILSAGTDSSMRIFNLVTELANKSLGHASFNKTASKRKGGKKAKHSRMSSIVNFTTGIPSNIEFDDVAAVHLDHAKVSTWSTHYERMSEVHIVHNRFKCREIVGEACSVCFSCCMNFLIVGYSTGHVDKFNIQSGICRGSYGESVTGKAHNGPVRGVATDCLNKVVVTGGGDQCIKFWVFKHCDKPWFSKIKLEDGVSFFCSHQQNSMLAVALDNYDIVLIDVESRLIVRKFIGHTAIIKDITFSPDCRWLISAAMDSTIRTWDIPSGNLIDYILLEVPCISLSMSPTGEYLATIHVNCFGIYLWTNLTIFNHVTLKPITDISQARAVSLTTLTDELPKSEISQEECKLVESDFKEQIDDLITLTQAITLRWQNILDIDVIRKRNKPKAPPKKPEAAPFFLPTIPALNLQFDFSDVQNEGRSLTDDKLSNVANLTLFGKQICQTEITSDFKELIETIKNMSPSAINVEINSLVLNDDMSVKLILQFMKMIEFMLQTRQNFELAQSYLGLLLKIHGDFIVDHSKLIDMLEQLQSLQASMWTKLENNLLYSLSIVEHIKSS